MEIVSSGVGEESCTSEDVGVFEEEEEPCTCKESCIGKEGYSGMKSAITGRGTLDLG